MVSQSMLKFLVDVGVGRKVEKWLIENGYDVKSVLDIDPKMPDDNILKIANSELRMVLTMDKDFGELVFKQRQNHFGVLILRLEDANAEQKKGVIKEILTEYSKDIINKFCVFQDGTLRIRS